MTKLTTFSNKVANIKQQKHLVDNVKDKADDIKDKVDNIKQQSQHKKQALPYPAPQNWQNLRDRLMKSFIEFQQFKIFLINICLTHKWLDVDFYSSTEWTGIPSYKANYWCLYRDTWVR